MHITGTTRLLGILGHPLAHSHSPAMHNAALGAIGLDAVYVPLPVLPADLGAAVAGLRAMGFLGANVTLPHKTAVIPHLDGLSPLSRRLGAVNTIVNRGGTLVGESTDAAGFLAAFEDEGHSFDGKSVAILGSGGSARTIAIALPGERRVKRITLVARSVEKAAALAEEVRSLVPGASVEALSVAEYARVRGDHDVVVNATPLGMHPAVDDTPLAGDLLEPGQIVYDIVYNPAETRLLREARARGCRTVGGLGMLVHQGRISFEMWTGRSLPAGVFLEGIRAQQARAAEATA